MQLKANNITKKYNQGSKNETLVFENMNFSLSSEKIVAIYGPSGIGKSTFLNMLGTLDVPDEGDIFLEGMKYCKTNYLKLRKEMIGYIFQFDYLLPEFTVCENIELALLIKGVGKKNIRKKIKKLLNSFNIENKINSYPSELSGGEKQRVAISRAIINDPFMVLADEPTGNLDDDNSEMLLKQIKEISRARNVKFIIATHDRRFEKIADSVYEIKHNNMLIKNI
ncbi:MAG: lipoprotein-releasing system ATP-binding protein LolD [Candidatus Marinimicrobia bacterium]|nr:lipoprotein-releasing system ATP-binding protein LolD [Candidatus Neomarinimicrobiota bacterium]|tara:strand:+ start:4346 stop:5017 length:672 start_codon:yes stop_codon:yes gene_type:complete